MVNPDSILKSRDITLPTNIHLVKAIVSPVSHVWMWELEYKESWVLKNCCFWTVVLEKTLESPLDCKEIQPVHPKENQSWVCIGRADVEAETPVFWPADVNSWLIGKDPNAGKDGGQKGKKASEDEMNGWHHWFDGHELGQTSGDAEGQRGLACCSPWVTESDMTGRLKDNNRMYCQVFL